MQQPTLRRRIQRQNQCVFLRGFRIALREGFFGAFREPLGVSSVENATFEDIFGPRGSSAPFSPAVGESGSWFSGGILSSKWSSQQASTSHNPMEDEEKDSHPNDVILELIPTTSGNSFLIHHYMS